MYYILLLVFPPSLLLLNNVDFKWEALNCLKLTQLFPIEKLFYFFFVFFLNLCWNFRLLESCCYHIKLNLVNIYILYEFLSFSCVYFHMLPCMLQVCVSRRGKWIKNWTLFFYALLIFFMWSDSFSSIMKMKAADAFLECRQKNYRLSEISFQIWCLVSNGILFAGLYNDKKNLFKDIFYDLFFLSLIFFFKIFIERVFFLFIVFFLIF